MDAHGGMVESLVGPGILSAEVVEGPMGSHVRFTVCTAGKDFSLPGLSCDLLESAKEAVDDSCFGADFETGGPCGPGRVSAEGELLLGWDVAFRAIGELDVEMTFEGRESLQLQPGDCVDLIGEGGDAQAADADRLQL